MLTPSGATVRLFLHVLGATVWVGGQLTLAALYARERTGKGPRKTVAGKKKLIARK